MSRLHLADRRTVDETMIFGKSSDPFDDTQVPTDSKLTALPTESYVEVAARLSTALNTFSCPAAR